MKKMNFYQVKEKKYLDTLNFDLTLEVNFYGETIYGKYGGYDHHTQANENDLSPANNPEIHFMNKTKLDLIERVVFIKYDLDVAFATVAIIFNELLNELGLFNLTIWASVEKVDKKGIRAFEEDDISDRDRYIMESVWAAQKAGLLPAMYQKEGINIMDVTESVYEYANFIKNLLINENCDKYKDLISDWKKDLNEKIENCLVVENELIRVFDTTGIPVNNAYYSNKYEKKTPLILSYNSNKKSIRLSTCEEDKYNCKEIVQAFWGAGAGGHKGIGASPRNKDLSYVDLFEFYEFLKKEI